MLVGIPDKILVPWLGKRKYIAPADEGEAVAIGAGHYLATGKSATVFMSADGFCNALNPITSHIVPSSIKMNFVISVGRREIQHFIMSDILEKIIKLLNHDTEKIHFEFIRKE